MPNFKKFLFAAAFGLLNFMPLAAHALETGDAAPAFELQDQSGKKVSLSDFKGRYLVLHWTNQNCPFVERHYKAGTFNEIASHYKGKPVSVVAIDSTRERSVEDIKKTHDEHSLSYPILSDVSGVTGKAYGAKTTPHVFIIDPEGKLVYTGAVDNDPDGDLGKDKINYVTQVLDEALAKKPLTVVSNKSYGCGVKYAS